jgi:N-methylhydantoinase A
VSDSHTSNRCRLAVDIGGTFTDLVLETPSGRHSCKVLTTPGAPDDAVLDGIGQLMSRSGLKPDAIDLILHGTTLATNALIERKGARTALVTTAGFRDILEMGFEKRFAQYNLDATRPAPLVPRVWRYGVDERIAASGDIVQPLQADELKAIADDMQQHNIESVAIGFLHAYAYPQHEQLAAEALARALPGVSISTSSEVCPELREYERFSTTVANAYVQPLMASYLERLQQRLQSGGFGCPVFLMQSGGGLTTLSQAMRLPIRLVESGPAGGAILAADVALSRGIKKALAFDMGGTTAKLSLIENGEPARSRSFEIAREYRDMKGSGLPVRIPVIEMVEIGAGGGSVARVDSMQRIRVGPDSAGSDPGPVAYANGGTMPTVTDANLLLGKIDPDNFAAGTIKLDTKAATQALQQHIGDALQLSAPWPSAGIVEIVEENMANAARVHAVERGREASEYCMIAFGGGAPLHAARLAEKLGIDQVVVPVGAGVGSAIGFLNAPVSYQVVRSNRGVLGQLDLSAINDLLQNMSNEANAVAVSGAGQASLYEQRQVELRYLGQGHELAVDIPNRALTDRDLVDIRTSFEARYQSVYKLTMPESEVECVSWSVLATTDAFNSPLVDPLEVHNTAKATGTRNIFDPVSGNIIAHQVFHRQQLNAGDHFAGPAIVVEDETATLIPPGFDVNVDSGQALVLSRQRNA